MSPLAGRFSDAPALREQDLSLADDLRVLLEEYEIVRGEGFLEQDYAFRSGAPIDDGADSVMGRTFGAYRLAAIAPLFHSVEARRSIFCRGCDCI